MNRFAHFKLPALVIIRIDIFTLPTVETRQTAEKPRDQWNNTIKSANRCGSKW
jgi:hypothetical protein